MNRRSHRIVVLRIAGRVLAAMLCLPVMGGSALGPLLDAIIYPHGACCCVRAHGLAHHCHCAAQDDDANAQRVASCPYQFDEGGTEFGTPPMRAVPPIVLAMVVDSDLEIFTTPQRSLHEPVLGSRSLPPPPTPPPNLA